MPKQKRSARGVRRQQRGLVLTLLVFLIGLMATGVAVEMLAMGSFRAQTEADDSRALLQAKQALVGYVIAGLSGEVANPGRFPCPENQAYMVRRGKARRWAIVADRRSAVLPGVPWAPVGSRMAVPTDCGMRWRPAFASSRSTAIHRG